MGLKRGIEILKKYTYTVYLAIMFSSLSGCTMMNFTENPKMNKNIGLVYIIRLESEVG